MTEDSAASALAAWLERIEAMHPTEIELGLERIHQVACRLGVDAMPVPVITVAGTNGKGSTLRLMQV
ncbi:MAG TPA: bifunctional folylpolyglutamate synthase/dihydrofolate synthase, partial [Alcanivorax sp.]|nr:bifunctional folylpolyglutamate synthase/dihydrofolate synthase [Alcanivorax sp.]